MAVELAVGYVQLVPSARGFSSATTKQLAGVGTDIGSRVGSDITTSLSSSLSSGLSRAGQQLSSVGSTLTKSVTLPLVGIGAAAATVGLRTTAGLEQAQVAFTTLLGSGQEAKTFLADLKEFGAKTPFELPGLVDASRQLLGVGAEASDVIPILTDFGDAAGALGLSQDAFNRVMLATTQAMSNGKLQAGDMLQITQAGIPIWSLLSKALGKPVTAVRKMSEEGKLLTADVLPKLQAQMHKDYGGAMAKQSQTLTGLWSTFKDTLSIGLADSLTGAMPEIKAALRDLTAALGPALKAAGPAFADLIRAITPLVPMITDLAEAFSGADPATQGLVMRLIGAAAVAGPVLIGFGKIATGLGAVTRGIGGVAKGVGGFAGHTADLVRGFRSADAAADASTGKMGTLGGAFRKAGSGALDGAKAVGSFALGLGKTVATGALNAAKAVGSFALGIGKAGAAAALNAAKIITVNAAALVVRVGIMAWTAAQWLLNMALNANPIGIIIMAIAALVAAILWLWNNNEGFRNFVIAAWNKIKEIVGAVVSWFQEHLVPIFKAVFGAIVRYVQFVAGFWRKVWDTIWNVVENVVGWIGGGIEKLGGFFTGFVEFLKNVGKGIFNALTWPFRKGVELIIGAINAMIGLWNGLRFEIHTPDLPGTDWGGLDWSWDSPDLPTLAVPDWVAGMAGGGLVGGRGRGDTQLRALDPREYVLTPGMVRQAGLRGLEAWRHGGTPPSGGGRGLVVEQLTVNNPTPEPASTSLPRAIRRAAYVGQA